MRQKLNSYFHSTACMVLVALAVRLAVMGFLYPEQLDPARDHWRFAYENGRLARSIAQGHGFSSPLFADTGPSAWMTPVYPYFIAAVFKLFGIYSTASAFVLLGLQAIISALTCLPIFYFTDALLGRRVALWAGWAWVFFPYAIYFPEERIWGTWLATLLVSILFLVALYLEKSDRLSHWIGYGLLWAFTALTEPVALSAWPFMTAWSCYCLYRRKSRWLAPLVASTLALVVAVTPWFLRNEIVFGKFIPFRDTLGLELFVGNSGDNSHWHPSWTGPWHNEEDWAAFQKLGEVAYMEREKRRGIEFIRSHPRWFAIATVRRFVYIWTGYWSFDKDYLAGEPLDPPNVFLCTVITVLAFLGLLRLWKKDPPRAACLGLLLISFPLVFYVTHPEVYVRRQIDPIIVVLTVYGVMGWRAAKQTGDGVPGVPGA